MHPLRRNRRPSLALCLLETRDTPTGSVTAALAGGVLTLTGDDADNFVQVQQDGPSSFTVTGILTNIVGGPTFTGVNSIVANMADGNDDVQLTGNIDLDGDGLLDFSVSGSLTLNGDDGDNNLGLNVGGAIHLSALTINCGDGLDQVAVFGGAGKASTISGNASINLGIGRGDQPSEPQNISMATLGNLNIAGLGGLKFAGAEGHEELSLQGVNITHALNANGGDGTLWVTTVGGQYGSATLSAVGFEFGNPFRGVFLSAGGTTILGATTINCKYGIALEGTDFTTGAFSMLSTSRGTVTADFLGHSAIHGKLTVRGFRTTISVQSDATLIIDGDLVETASGQASLSASDARLDARNVSVTGSGGVDFTIFDFDPLLDAHLNVAGAMTLRGPTVEFTQTGGQAAIGGRLALFGTTSGDFRTGVGSNFNDTPAKTTAGSILVQGRIASYAQTESEATFTTGLSVVGSELAIFQTDARFQNEDPSNPGVFDSAAGAKTTVTQGPLMLKSKSSAEYFQTEGVATYQSLSILAPIASISNDVSQGIMSVGPKLSVTSGPAVIQGTSASFIHVGGEATFAAGLTVVGTEDTQFVASVGETHDAGFNNFFDLPAKVTVATGTLKATGGTGDCQFSSEGEFLHVAGDLILGGAGLNRLSLDSTAGTTVGGSIKVSGATGDPDFFSNSTNLSVGKDVSIALGGGSNSIGIGAQGATTTIGGNLTLSGGNGSDLIAIAGATVTGTTSILTGSAADILTLHDSTFNGLMTADLGGGSDTFNVGNEAGWAGPVTFNAKATVKMGIGNDAMALGLAIPSGGDLNSRVAFGALGNLTVDGGPNLNSFDDELGQFDTTKVTAINFIDPTP